MGQRPSKVVEPQPFPKPDLTLPELTAAEKQLTGTTPELIPYYDKLVEIYDQLRPYAATYQQFAVAVEPPPADLLVLHDSFSALSEYYYGSAEGLKAIFTKMGLPWTEQWEKVPRSERGVLVKPIQQLYEGWLRNLARYASDALPAALSSKRFTQQDVGAMLGLLNGLELAVDQLCTMATTEPVCRDRGVVQVEYIESVEQPLQAKCSGEWANTLLCTALAKVPSSELLTSLYFMAPSSSTVALSPQQREATRAIVTQLKEWYAEDPIILADLQTVEAKLGEDKATVTQNDLGPLTTWLSLPGSTDKVQPRASNYRSLRPAVAALYGYLRRKETELQQMRKTTELAAVTQARDSIRPLHNKMEEEKAVVGSEFEAFSRLTGIPLASQVAPSRGMIKALQRRIRDKLAYGVDTKLAPKLPKIMGQYRETALEWLKNYTLSVIMTLSGMSETLQKIDTNQQLTWADFDPLVTLLRGDMRIDPDRIKLPPYFGYLPGAKAVVASFLESWARPQVQCMVYTLLKDRGLQFAVDIGQAKCEAAE